jgi:hypothetical protein
MTASIIGSAAWPPAAVATVLGAVLALAGAGASTVWAVLRWRREADRAARRERWDRAVWAVEMASSDDPLRVEIGRGVAEAMSEIPIPRHDDGDGVKVILDALRTTDTEESRDDHGRVPAE